MPSNRSCFPYCESLRHASHKLTGPPWASEVKRFTKFSPKSTLTPHARRASESLHLYRRGIRLMSIRTQNSFPLLALLAALLTTAGTVAAQSSYDLRSPDNRIEIRIRTVPAVRYDVLLKGRALLQDCTLSLDIDHKTLGLEPKVRTAKKRSYDQTVGPPVRQKFARIRENYNELRLEMEGGYAVVFRAYNEGAAYRFETSLPQQQVKVYGEEVKFNFPGDSIVYYPQEDSMFSHNERKYVPQRLKEIDPAFIATMPAVVDAGDCAQIAYAVSAGE